MMLHEEMRGLVIHSRAIVHGWRDNSFSWLFENISNWKRHACKARFVDGDYLYNDLRRTGSYASR